MDRALKAQRYLDALQAQIIHLEEKAAQDPEVDRKLKHLRHQIEFLRAQIDEHAYAW